MQRPDISFMHTPDSATEEQVHNREIEFQTTKRNDTEAPLIGILAITAVFVFLVVLFNIFSSTNQPASHTATPSTEVRVLPQPKPFPTPLPMPNAGPTPTPAPQD
jgi:hypothetical protein